MAETQERTTRVALVGAGYIADNHIQALGELPFVEIAAIVDPNATRARALVDRHGIAHHFDDVAALLDADCGADVAHVLVPPPLHVEVASQLIAGGIGAFVEKPLGLSASGCDKLIDLAAAHGVVLGVNHNMCFHPAYRSLAERVAANEIGPPQHVVSITNLPLRQLAMRQFGHWMFQHPKNVLFEIGCHPFSMIHDILGEASAATTRLSDTAWLAGELEFHKSWRTLLDCERGTAMAYISLGREFLASRIAVIGPDGSLEADLVTGAVTRGYKTRWPDFYDITRNAKLNAGALSRTGRRSFWGYLGQLFKIVPRNDLFYVTMRDSIRAFHEAVHAGHTPRMDGERGRAAVKFCEHVWDGRDTTTPRPRPARPAEPEPTAPNGTTVLVTGGTGFIGSHLVAKLCAAGYDVRAFVRSTGFIPPWLEHPRVHIVEGNLQNRDHVRAALDGVDCVMHLATALFDTWEETHRANVEPTKELAKACIASSAKLIFTSTIAALYVGNLSTSDKVTADLPIDLKPNGRSLYARGKIACEQALFELAEKAGLELVNLRPGLVVGARGRTRHSGVGYWPQDNHCLSWGAGEHPLPFVLASDVAEALVAAVDNAEAVGKSFNLVGEVRLSGSEYVAELAKITQRPIEFHPQNLALVQVIDVFKWVVKIAARKPGNVFPSYRDLTTRALRPWFDCTAAREILGWRPQTDRARFIDQGLRVPVEEGG